MEKAVIKVDENSGLITITITNGEKFEIVPEKDGIKVYSSTHIGSSLIVHPSSNSSIKLKQGSI